MKTTHNSKLQLEAPNAGIYPTDVTRDMPAYFFLTFSALPVLNIQLHCAITYPLRDLTFFYALPTMHNAHIYTHPYCSRIFFDDL